MSKKEKIIYTITDEAPALATASLLPIIKAFSNRAGIEIETRNISLASRILSQFPLYLKDNQKQNDDLAYLGDLVKKTEANIIKLPNISASIPQLKAAIKELQDKGYKIPDYPDAPSNEEEKTVKSTYDKLKGSAVNPVLREGNSDRRAPRSVKEYAKKNPHSMGKWSSDSKSNVASMADGDFYGSEKSVVIKKDSNFKIQQLNSDGSIKVLKESSPLIASEIIDAAVMSKTKLRAFIKEQIQVAKDKDILFSVHLKATMMKVSDPIIFGHVVSVFFEDLFNKYRQDFKTLGINPNNGLGDLEVRIKSLPSDKQKEIEAMIKNCYDNSPKLAMVNSDKGITNLHVPSDVIIDASMPAAIRTSGGMWGPDGGLHDMLAMIPDRSYAGVYQASIDYCRDNGAFNPATMGSVSNVGLMAQKAEEYGSHDKTFEIEGSGDVQIVETDGTVLLSQKVEEGDIFRMCQVKDAPIQDWVKLAVQRSRLSKTPAVFWLDENRAHDRQIRTKVDLYLKDHNTDGLEIHIKNPIEATHFSMERISKGLDTISVTGNILRDYLTDLFPILELGTSSKVLSVVPLMEGGGLFETGAGGSAPKHVQQFEAEGHLRWDSLGEFLALSVSYEHLGRIFNNQKALVLADCLDSATSKFLDQRRSPSRKVNEIDNRGSHFFLTLYWANAIANQKDDSSLAETFTSIASELSKFEDKINSELITCQGKPMDLGGYYLPVSELKIKAMRPSSTFNAIIDKI